MGALTSFLKCSPAQTSVFLANNTNEESRWVPWAMTGVLPIDSQLRSSIPVLKTPILDRLLRDTSSTAGKSGPKESYLPTLQTLPGRVEFSYPHQMLRKR